MPQVRAAAQSRRDPPPSRPGRPKGRGAAGRFPASKAPRRTPGMGLAKKIKKDGKGSTFGEKKKKAIFFVLVFFFPTFWKCPGGRRGAGKVPAGPLPAARRLFVAVARPLLSARRRGFPRGTN